MDHDAEEDEEGETFIDNISNKKKNFEQQPVQYHDDDKDPCKANDSNAKLCCMAGIK